MLIVLKEFNICNTVVCCILFLLFQISTFAQSKCFSNEEAAKVTNSINNPQSVSENKQLRRELVKMQELREKLIQDIIDYSEDNLKLISNADEMAEKHLLRLCEIIKQNGWITKNLVGDDGVKAASFIIFNSKNAQLLREILPVASIAAKKGLISTFVIAALIDGIRIDSNLPQIFGTQYQIKDELFYLYPIQNETKVDDLRKLYGLQPLANFIKNIEIQTQMPVIKSPRLFTPPQLKEKTSAINSSIDSNLSVDNDDVVKVDSVLVNLNVKVFDNNSVGTSNLKKEDFAVFEDDKEQEISFFSPPEAPSDLVIMVDFRGWANDKYDWVSKAVERFIKASKPSDRIAFLVWGITEFKDDYKRYVSNLTTNHQEILHNVNAIRGNQLFFKEDLVKIKAVTKNLEILDAIDATENWSELIFAYEHIIKPQSKGRKSTIVFITPGIDCTVYNRFNPGHCPNPANITFSKLLETVKNGDTTVIPIYLNLEEEMISFKSGTTIPDGNGQIIPPSPKLPLLKKVFRQSRRTLNMIAEESGGQIYSAKKLSDLDGIYDAVIEDMKNVYTIGYEPKNNIRDGTWRNLSVKIKNRPNLIYRTRSGYYAK